MNVAEMVIRGGQSGWSSGAERVHLLYPPPTAWLQRSCSMRRWIGLHPHLEPYRTSTPLPSFHCLKLKPPRMCTRTCPHTYLFVGNHIMSEVGSGSRAVPLVNRVQIVIRRRKPGGGKLKYGWSGGGACESVISPPASGLHSLC